MRNTPDGLRRATRIFEAAIWHYAVEVTCRCGHSAKFEAADLWWRFERKGWNDSFREARRHFWCRPCAARLGRRVQPVRVDVTEWEKGVIALGAPDEREWKRAVRRFRC
jgi:hypothetical protein